LAIDPVYRSDMKSMHYLLLVLAGFLVSCGSPNYFLKEASKGDPHAVLSLRNGIFNGLFGAPGQEVSAQAIMPVDLGPGKFYRPEATINAAGTYFFLRDESGIRSSLTRSFTSSY